MPGLKQKQQTCRLAIVGALVLALQGAILPSSATESLTPGAVAQRQFLAKPNVVSWLPGEREPRAAILCIHGLGLHKGAYADFGKAMAADGFATFALDLRGFGSNYQKGDQALDFPGTLKDIHETLEQISQKYQGIPIFVLGESMGGAIALRVAVENANLVSGVVSSVPSGDRFSDVGYGMKIGLRILAGGLKSQFNAGDTVINYGTQKSDLRQLWSSDPAGRKQFSPAELMQFQSFMSKNFEIARQIKTTPILVIQGAHDKLVRPTGTWDVWNDLGASDKQLVLSENGEHLIFEYGQFSKADLKYLTSWLDRHRIAAADQKPDSPTLSDDEALASKPANSGTPSPMLTPKPAVSSVQPVAFGHGGAESSISYWVELKREGKRYRCNNKTVFKSGDEIRFHMIAGSDGFAYILMKQGTSGARAVLFPESRTGRANQLSSGEDCAIPTSRWLQFDNKSGMEKLSLIFSRKPLDPHLEKYDTPPMVAMVSSDKSGSKDICPTRMKLSWDEPYPVIMPSAASAGATVASAGAGSLVKVSTFEPDSVLSVDVELNHQ